MRKFFRILQILGFGMVAFGPIVLPMLNILPAEWIFYIIILGVPMLLIGSFGWMAAPRYTARTVATLTKEAIATVTDAKYTLFSGPRGDGRLKVQLSFTTEDGRAVNVSDTFEFMMATRERVKTPGVKIPIYYSEKNPKLVDINYKKLPDILHESYLQVKKERGERPSWLAAANTHASAGTSFQNLSGEIKNGTVHGTGGVRAATGAPYFGQTMQPITYAKPPIQSNRQWQNTTGGAAAPQGSAQTANTAAKVDINSCTAQQLVNLPGIGAEKAKQIVERRKERGGYTSFTEFFIINDLEPHFMKPLENLVEVGQKGGVAEPFGGRRLDI